MSDDQIEAALNEAFENGMDDALKLAIGGVLGDRLSSGGGHKERARLRDLAAKYEALGRWCQERGALLRREAER